MLKGIISDPFNMASLAVTKKVLPTPIIEGFLIIDGAPNLALLFYFFIRFNFSVTILVVIFGFYVLYKFIFATISELIFRVKLPIME